MKYKKHFIIILLGTLASVGTYTAYQDNKAQPITPAIEEVVPPPAPVPAPAPQPSASQCDPALWQFVYHPNRLKVLDACKTIEGILVNFVQEADGDFHGRVDVADKTLINADNIAGQHGYLVIEGVCQYPITQADAIQPCQGYNGPKFDLNQFLGKKIRVSGSYIQDTQHTKGAGGWLELHPVSNMTILP